MNSNKVANFEYGKIKRKHPSTYEIDVAYEKEILHQLIKGSNRGQSSNQNQNKPQTSHRRRNNG